MSRMTIARGLVAALAGATLTIGACATAPTH